MLDPDFHQNVQVGKSYHYSFFLQSIFQPPVTEDLEHYKTECFTNATYTMVPILPYVLNISLWKC